MRKNKRSTSPYFNFWNKHKILIILRLPGIFLHRKTSFILKLVLVLFWLGYAISNMQGFLRSPSDNLIGTENFVKAEINAGRTIPFEDKKPSPYMYYVLTGKIGEPIKE